MKFALFITGCQYNYYDASKIARLFKKLGYLYTKKEKEADVVVALACSVRQKPMDRIYGKLKIWKNSKKKPKIIVMGCVLAKDKKKLEQRVIFLNSIGRIKDVILSAPVKQAVERSHFVNKDSSPAIQINFKNRRGQNDSEIADFTPMEALADTAYIPIMQGCNNFCTYCAVPYTRGREKSRKTKEIIQEIKQELKKGKKHIVLLGQNVNSYQLSVVSFQKKNSCHPKLDLKSQASDFSKLLKQIDKISGNFDYNFLSANPRNFSQELIETLPKLKKWRHELHIPLQSGDYEILKKMNRKYSASQYLKLISNLKLRVTNLKFSTDIIVGFPGETKKQFNNTVLLCKKVGFSKAFVNQYSPRSGTFAAKNYADDVPPIEKKQRWKVLNNLINKKTVSN